MSERDEIHEWAQRRNDALAARKWARACRRQIERFDDAYRRAHAPIVEHGIGTFPDQDAREQSFTDGHFLIVAADHLRSALASGVHVDLLGELPLPEHTDLSQPGAATDGATWFRHVRNAHEHNDDRGRFRSTYGYNHGGMAGQVGDPLGVDVGGIQLWSFRPALDVIEAELDRRHTEATERHTGLLSTLAAEQDEDVSEEE